MLNGPVRRTLLSAADVSARNSQRTKTRWRTVSAAQATQQKQTRNRVAAEIAIQIAKRSSAAWIGRKRLRRADRGQSKHLLARVRTANTWRRSRRAACARTSHAHNYK